MTELEKVSVGGGESELCFEMESDVALSWFKALDALSDDAAYLSTCHLVEVIPQYP